jgi:hypothetical protein
LEEKKQQVGGENATDRFPGQIKLIKVESSAAILNRSAKMD